MGFSLSSLFGGGQSGSTKKGMGLWDAGTNAQLLEYRKRQEDLQRDEASGAFNADAALKGAQDQIEHSFDINSGNYAAKLGGYGYKNGDSNIAQGTRNLSAKSKLEGEGVLMAIKRLYEDRHSLAKDRVAQAGSNYANSAYNTGSGYVNYGAREEANSGFGSIFSGLASLFPGKGGGGQSGAVGNVAQQATQGIGAGAGASQGNYLQRRYDEYGNLIA